MRRRERVCEKKRKGEVRKRERGCEKKQKGE
jgi:hypothetical protein